MEELSMKSHQRANEWLQRAKSNKESVPIPEDLHTARILTAYAVETRYPGEYEPVNEDDYLNAIALAEKVVKCVEARMSEYVEGGG
jgi:HEPN domain-containing protein